MITSLLANHPIGDIASILGVIISVIGFIVTITNVIRSKNIARETSRKISSVLDDVKRIDTVGELSSSIMAMKEIMGSNLRDEIISIPDKCAMLRKNLITIRASYPKFDDSQSSIIQKAITTMGTMEHDILEKQMKKEQFLGGDKLVRNKKLGRHIDELQVLLVSLKNEIGGEFNGHK